MWSRKNSYYFTFHYIKGSFAHKNLPEIIRFQESCHEHVCGVLRIKADPPLACYLCETVEQVGDFTGNLSGTISASRLPDTMAMIYTESRQAIGFYEEVKLIAGKALGTPTQLILREGLANYFERLWKGFPQAAWLQCCRANRQYPGIQSFLANESFERFSQDVSGPLSGVFIDYLIAMSGIEKMKAFYRTVGPDFEQRFLEHFGVSITYVEDRMINYVDGFLFDRMITDTIFQLMESVLKPGSRITRPAESTVD
jgi:hypothetical protein